MADMIDTAAHVEHLTGDAAVEAGNVKEDAGFRRVPRVSEAQVARAGEMMAAAFDGGFTGRRAQLALTEAFTTSDFQWAAFVVLDRETIAQYQEIPTTSDRWVDTTTVRDFRPKRLTDFTQSGFTLEPVGELAPYPMQDRKGGFEQSISVAKYGRRYAISWESMINDQLDELADLPNALATAAREAEQIKALSLLLNFNPVTGTGSGPNTNLFKNYTGTYGPSTPFAGVNATPATLALTYENLLAAVNTLNMRKSPQNGRPIVLPGRYQLIVPPELAITANAILSLQYRDTTVGGVTTRQGNEVAPLVDLIVEPWLTWLDKGAKAATTWYLVPPKGSSFKAFMTAKLRGHETPEMRVRADTGNSVGGGALSPQDGSFDIDDLQYRVRHIMGGTTLNPLAVYASTGP